MNKYELYYIDEYYDEYREFAESDEEIIFKVDRVIKSEEFDTITITKLSSVN